MLDSLPGLDVLHVEAAWLQPIVNLGYQISQAASRQPAILRPGPAAMMVCCPGGKDDQVPSENGQSGIAALV
jgi:hypothetical protein